MHRLLSRRQLAFLSLGLSALLASCALPPTDTPDAREQTRPACSPSEAADGLIGNWLVVRTQKGVAGELRTLFTLNPDGSMAYTEQLKRPGSPSQGLSETGCWHREDQTLVMRTYESNGLPVDLDDPIYINRYPIVAADEKMLRLSTPEGVTITAGRVSAGYRLPF